jgi:phosphate transport system substrate-binding protein
LLLKRLASVGAATLLAGGVLGLLTTASASAAAKLVGEGSTLVAPLEAEWAAAWDSATGNTVLFTADGSGAGYKGIANNIDQFGASDAPLSAYSSPPCSACIQIPWALSATGVSYNIPGLRLPRGKALHLSPQDLAGIYLGQITNWSDHRITSLNKGAHIPSQTITPIWRNDASGDSFAFSSELSDVSSAFRGSVGPSTQPAFPKGVGAKGNSGMATTLHSTPGGIAYISVAYLLANSLPAAAVRNNHGNYEVPNLNAIESAASVFHSVPGNRQLTIVNPSKRAKNAYPISTYTYVIVHDGAAAGSVLQSFIGYCLTGGQRFGPRLGFAPLPKNVLHASQAALGSV